MVNLQALGLWEEASLQVQCLVTLSFWLLVLMNLESLALLSLYPKYILFVACSGREVKLTAASKPGSDLLGEGDVTCSNVSSHKKLCFLWLQIGDLSTMKPL